MRYPIAVCLHSFGQDRWFFAFEHNEGDFRGFANRGRCVVKIMGL